MKRYLLITLSLYFLAFSSGCAMKDLPAVMLIPKNIDSTQEPVVNSSLKEITVTIGKDVDPYLNEENFKIALYQIVTRANIFGSDEQHPVVMTVDVYKASAPIGGFTMTGWLGARYKIVRNNEVIFDEDVYFETSAGVSEAFLGSARALLVLQNTNQGHMDLLLQKLRTKLRDTAMDIRGK